MASTSNKPFHTYENVGYDEQANSHVASIAAAASASLAASNIITKAVNSGSSANIAINKTTIDTPFPDPLLDSSNVPSIPAGRILSATDSTGTTRMLTSRAVPSQNLVTKFISLPSQSPMDSFREWSVSTFKCTKQMINEKRGICSKTNDAQLQADIEQLRETRNKLVEMLKVAQQMNSHYSQLVKTQRQLHGLMNEMSIKCFTSITNNSSNSLDNDYGKQSGGKQIVANFSSLSNNLSSTTATSPKHTPVHSSSHDNLSDLLPILNHMKSSNSDLTEDFKKNAITLNSTIRNGEKLVAALTFFCSNLSTLISKTIEDTLSTVKMFEFARLEYDAERNSMNFTSPTAQTSITYSSDKLELVRVRYEQLKEDVQIKMKFLEENSIKVLHKQLLLFNSAFASYSSGNTAALESTLKQFSIRNDIANQHFP